MLKVNHVTKYYGDFKAVDDLNFTVSPGEIFGLVGPNGAGKTTTFREILNLLKPTEGTITLFDKKIDYDTLDRVGFLPEERSLLTEKSVEDQLMLIARLKGLSTKDANKKIDELLSEFKLADSRKQKIKELSKGNQQKIQFIQSIINEPDLLILDEPFSGLDPINVEIFKKEIHRLKKKGTMIIFSSHRMENIEELCDKILIINKGRTLAYGTLTEISSEYEKTKVKVAGNISKDTILKYKGIEDIKNNIKDNEYFVKFEDNKTAKQFFEDMKNKDITKLELADLSLNDIFIDKVGKDEKKD